MVTGKLTASHAGSASFLADEIFPADEAESSQIGLLENEVEPSQASSAAVSEGKLKVLQLQMTSLETAKKKLDEQVAELEKPNAGSRVENC